MTFHIATQADDLSQKVLVDMLHHTCIIIVIICNCIHIVNRSHFLKITCLLKLVCVLPLHNRAVHETCVGKFVLSVVALHLPSLESFFLVHI